MFSSDPMNRKHLLFSILACVSGILFSSYLLGQHYQVKAGLEVTGFCDVNDQVNCQIVLQSPYSEFLTVPIAGLGLIYYIIILLYVLVILSSKTKKRGGLFFCLYLSLLALSLSILLLYVSLFKLGGLCPFCVGMYVVNLLLFVLIAKTLQLRFRDLPRTTLDYIKALFRANNNLGLTPRIGLHFFSSLTILIMGLILIHYMGLSQTKKALASLKQNKEGSNPLVSSIQKDVFTVDQIVDMHFSQNVIEINPEGSPRRGVDHAPVTLIDFSDFECPFCQVAATELKTLLMPYRTDIAFYYVNYPLDKSCNPHMQRELHKNACNAAKAALCAQKRGKFWEMHDIIFQNQKNLLKPNLLAYAKSLGFEEAWMENCMGSVEIKIELKREIDLAQKAGVNGTPSILLNGRKLGPWRNREFLRAVMEEELAQ